MLTSRLARPSDVPFMADRLRPEDTSEVYAAGGLSPLEALDAGLRHTPSCLSAVNERDEPVAMAGVVPSPDPMVGYIWMLATTEIEKHPISFLRLGIKEATIWQSQYPILTNCVDERNELHIKWLRWMGFTFIRRHPEYGHEQRPFLEFVRI